MCGLAKKLDTEKTLTSLSDQESESLAKPMNDAEWEHSFSALLEFAADDDVEGFKRQLSVVSCINQMGLWYRRQRFVRRMVVEQRTPLMVASLYGSLDVVKLILSFPEAELNLSCGPDKSTALHCAASGASVNSLDVVKLLLSAGADPNIPDAHGNRPVDVLVVSPHAPGLRTILEEILKKDEIISEDLHASSSSLGSSFRSLSSSPDNGSSLLSLDSVSSPTKPNGTDATFASEKKEYPIDPSLPDIKSGIYSTDEFRMFSFKIRPCSRAYSHDWTECPFAHPGENARRRDPRKFHYTCVPCPDFKKGSCKQGDMCEYAHGVFECWLHPAQYRTRLCKDGIGCNRRVCFFAHANEELRPLYPSTGSGLPSPRSSSTVSASTMDMASVLNMLPGSPSAAQHSFTPPISPSGNGGMPHSSMGWSQQNIPALNLPGSNIQLSRLRSSLNARDIPSEQLSMLHEFEMQRQLSGDMHSPRFMNHSARPKTLTPSNLEELFSAEVASPRFSDQLNVSSVLSPSHKSALLNQLQNNKQSMLSPIKTNLMSSPKNVEQHSLLHQASSPRAGEPISPMNARMKQQLHPRSLSSREFGSSLPRDLMPTDSGSPLSPWSNWDQNHGSKVDWSVQSDELGRLRKSHSLANNPNREADVSWAQQMLRDSASSSPRNGNRVVNMNGARPMTQGGSSVNPHHSDTRESDILESWLEQLQLDR
ncbi:PREDICTED: zinc finger CCCH domain-containing protein 56-like [Camelina sativa]|uniref:Zinc finger CCCH domain-containing protein 56-like n=1 Tax=Camelina sativa TaxID=90675 RepID=A0ABM0VAG6_CAMSA|nr:PREDICTED: zinc finger CCCH domain-containing protein 56-like [Camelina sativa]XP_010453334.1 PREDICTED: zinc finger CCCH domain-containing protein 56-like [Camelina sativa]